MQNQEISNESSSIKKLKEKLIKEIPFNPKNKESNEFLLSLKIDDILHIHHFWRQRFLRPVVRKFNAPSRVRNDPLYVSHKEKINALRLKIERGEDLSAYLSLRAHERALDVDGYRKTKSFNTSRDLLLICEGFYHLHLAPLPDRTDEIIVAKVTDSIFEVLGLFTHELFDENSLNSNYCKYATAVDKYLREKLPQGGAFIGGPGGGMQNAAGSSIESTFWQINCRRIINTVENHSGGINGFTIRLYKEIFDRDTKYVNPKWHVTDDGLLLIKDQKNKYEFWMERNKGWQSRQLS